MSAPSLHVINTVRLSEILVFNNPITIGDNIMDFVLFDHQLLLNRSNDIDYKEGIIKSTISLMNFLKKNGLLVDIEPFNEDGSIKENIVIRKSNVTDEGFQLFIKPVNNWWNALDRGTPPEKVTILENGLKKIRAAKK